MRIENAIHEIQDPKPLERRDAEVKRRRNTARGGDVVEISNAARTLGSQSVSRSDLESASDVRHARVEEVRQRVSNGFYGRREGRQGIADAVLDSGVVDSVGQEVRQVRSAQQQAADVPDVRQDRVAQAKQRVATDFYNQAGVTEEMADRFLDSLIG